MNDFRKYATKHLGMDGLVLDDVMKVQAEGKVARANAEKELQAMEDELKKKLIDISQK